MSQKKKGFRNALNENIPRSVVGTREAFMSQGLASRQPQITSKESNVQAPESMMKGISREELYKKSDYLFENFLHYYIKKNKIGLKKKKFKRAYGKLKKSGTLELYEFKESEDAHEILDLKDSSFKQKDISVFLLEAYANESDKKKGRTTVLLKMVDNLQYGNLIRGLKYVGLDDITKEKKKKTKKKKKSDHVVDDFYLKPVAEWDTEDVLKWSKCLIIGDDFKTTLYDHAEEILKKKKYTGQQILDFKKEDITNFCKEMSVTVYRMKTYVRKGLKTLKENGKYDPVDSVVTLKVGRMLEKQGQRKQALVIQKLVKAFSNKEFIKDNMKRIMFGEDSEDVKDQIFRIKLIIVENMRDDRMKRIRKLFGKVLAVKDAFSIEDDNTKYGLFHAALSIGPLQLEWVDTSIVIVRNVSSEKVLLCVDVCNVDVDDGEKFCSKLADKCIDWNREYEYEAFNMKKNKKYANCQGFVVDVLESLGVEYNFTKHINSYINKRLKREGMCKMVFDMDKKFQKKFKLKNSVYFPNDHSSFDEFVNGLFKIDNDFINNYPSEYSLLKGFDRAFWMKNMKNPGQHPPAKKTNEQFSGCPFCKTPPQDIQFVSSDDEADLFEEEKGDDDDDEYEDYDYD